MRILSLEIAFVAVVTAILLAGCNGGDNAVSTAVPTPSANKKPTANAGPDHQVDEMRADMLEGAGTDSDGTVTRYVWKQISGPAVMLTASGFDAAGVTYTAPDVSKTTVLEFQLSVMDDDGATDSDTVMVTVHPTVTLRGKVTDGPIAGAAVTVTAGGKTYTATSGADGTYSIVLPDTVGTDDFITIGAVGAGGQNDVRLISFAGTFGAVEAAAGADGILDAGDNIRVNVTNVSTAEAALVREELGTDPADDADLAAALITLDGGQVLEIAAVIKLIVDNPDQFSLPDGFDDVLALVEDTAARDAYLQQIKDDAAQAQALADSQAAILADTDLVAAVDRSAVPALMFAGNIPTRIDIDTEAAGPDGFVFNADGTGRFFIDQGSTTTTWTTDSTGIVVNFDEPIVTEGFPFIDCDNDGTIDGQFLVRYTANGILLKELGGRTLALEQDLDEVSPACPAYPERTETVTQGRTLLVPSDFDALTADDIAGDSLALPVFDAGYQGFAAFPNDVLDFAADGTGTSRLLGKSFNWSLADNALMVDFHEGFVGTYHLHALDSRVAFVFLDQITGNGGRFAVGHVSFRADPASTVAFDPSAIAGRYFEFGKSSGVSDSRLQGFRLRLDADGGGSQEDDYIETDESGNEAIVTDKADNDPYMALQWTLQSAGNLAVRRTFDSGTGQGACDPATDTNCKTFDERDLIPLAQDGDRLYWIERRQFDANNNGDNADDPVTYLARFYDRESLPASPPPPEFVDTFDNGVRNWTLFEEIVGGNTTCYGSGIGEIAKSTDYSRFGVNSLDLTTNKDLTQYSNHIIAERKLQDAGVDGQYRYVVYVMRDPATADQGQTGPEISVQNTRTLAGGGTETSIGAIQYISNPFVSAPWNIWTDTGSGSAGWVQFMDNEVLTPGVWYRLVLDMDFDTNHYISLKVDGQDLSLDIDLSGYVIIRESRSFAPSFYATLEGENGWTNCGQPNRPPPTRHHVFYDGICLGPKADGFCDSLVQGPVTTGR